jgi:hypothetical protein
LAVADLTTLPTGFELSSTEGQIIYQFSAADLTGGCTATKAACVVSITFTNGGTPAVDF